MKSNQPHRLIPIKIKDCVQNELYAVEAKRNKKFPKLGQMPYFMRFFGDLGVFYGRSINLALKEVKAVWKIEPQ
jgi:hypothetical protein